MPTLYITEPGTRLETEAGRLLVTRPDDTVLFSAPAGRVEHVVAVGNVGITTPALGLLLDRDIGLVFLTSGGRFRGRLSAGLSKNIELRQQQYRRADDSTFCLNVGRAIVEGKVRNCRTLCLRWARDANGSVSSEAARDLRAILPQLAELRDLAGLMGLEGQAARCYFRAFRHRVGEPWTFTRRARRPPPDPVNALLSLVYTLLHESCYSALEVAGLDPFQGYYHQPRYGRASLALDLMEEFRPTLADSVVLNLLNKRMLSPNQFRPAPNGEGVRLDRDGWRILAHQYDNRLATPVRPPGLKRAISYQKVLELQARRLRHIIQEQTATYQPMLVK